MPFCGVGADEIGKHIAGDPFGGYKNFSECVEKNKDKDNPEAYCGSIKAKTEKKDMFKAVLENMKSEIDAVLSKFEDVEELKGGEGETIVDETMSDADDLSGLLAFFRLTPESWDGLLDETRAILSSRWTELKKYYKDGDLLKMAGGELTPIDPVLQGDESEEDCLDCEEEAEEADEETKEEDEPAVKLVPFKPTKSIEDLLNRQ
jgi:hypothetical protein